METIPLPAWDFLNQRLSVPARHLGEPGPNEEQMARLLRLAVRVPDHGRLAPWRFIRIHGAARHTLGERLADLQQQRNPAAEAQALDKDRRRFAQAPEVIAVIARPVPNHKIPESEQWLSAGLVAYNLLLGAQALGFGAQWLTGWPAYDPQAKSLLGVEAHEKVVAFIHIGSVVGEHPADRPRADPQTLVTHLAL